MTIRIWGARGSIPVPGPATARYGGNTSCISIDAGDRVLVIDAGTGIRDLGASLMGSYKEIYILLSHIHSDHIQGFPFFGPLYQKGRVTNLLDHRMDDLTWSLTEMLDRRLFPLFPEEMPGELRRVQAPPLEFLEERGFAVTRARVHHPGGAYGYRITGTGGALVYIPDNELAPPEADPSWWRHVVSFCEGADILIHDCQYLSDDMPFKWGWGHSTLDDVCRLAIDAEVRHLVLFHHDPSRDDDMLEHIEGMARARMQGSSIRCTAAYEGLQFEMGTDARATGLVHAGTGDVPDGQS